MDDPKQLFYHRTFLNDKEGAAVVVASLTDATWTNSKTGEQTFGLEGEIQITDCSRSITLDVCCGSELTDAREATRKLDRLIDAAQGLRDAIARAVKREFGRKI